jgi:hypothetical protein
VFWIVPRGWAIWSSNWFSWSVFFINSAIWGLVGSMVIFLLRR